MMELRAFAGQDHQSHIMAHLIFGASPMVGQMPQVAVSLQKHILEHVKIQAEEAGMQQMQQMQGGDEAQMEMQYQTVVAQLVAQGMQQVKQLSGQISGQGPDPLVQLKEKELEIKAQSEQSDAQIDQAKTCSLMINRTCRCVVSSSSNAFRAKNSRRTSAFRARWTARL